MKKISNIKALSIIRDYRENNNSSTELAKKYKIGKTSVYRLLAKYNVKIRSCRKIDDTQIYNLIKDYTENKNSITNLSKKYNICTTHVTRILKKYDVNIRPWTPKLNLDDINLAKEMYANGDDCNKIAKFFNVSNTHIQRSLKNTSFKLRNMYELKRIYKMDKNYFDKIDTERKSYFLGFLYADGHNSGNFISISLAIKDRKILFELSKDIYGNNKIVRYGFSKARNKKYKCCYLNLSSKEMCEKLENNGMIIGNKTYTLKFPTFIDEELMPHFLRGYFDGDGCFSFGKRRKYLFSKTWRWRGCFSIVGCHKFISKLQLYLIKKLGVKKTKLSSKNKIKYLLLSSEKDLYLIYNYLYNNSTIYLDRKKNKWEEYFNNRSKNHVY